MSSGTGTATSQKSGIGWKDKLRHVWSGSFDVAKRPHAGVARSDGRRSRSVPTCSVSGAQAQVLHHHLQVFPGFALLARIAQKKCRMVGNRQFCSLPRRVAAARARRA